MSNEIKETIKTLQDNPKIKCGSYEFIGDSNVTYADIYYLLEYIRILESQLQQRDEVINEVIDVINKMITVGYTDEKHLTSYFAVGKDSEFGCRAKVILDILNKYKNN